MHDPELDSELASLRSFYADIDVRIVDAVWEQTGRDYKTSMEELAIAAKDPSGAAARLLQKKEARGLSNLSIAPSRNATPCAGRRSRASGSVSCGAVQTPADE